MGNTLTSMIFVKIQNNKYVLILFLSYSCNLFLSLFIILIPNLSFLSYSFILPNLYSSSSALSHSYPYSYFFLLVPIHILSLFLISSLHHTLFTINAQTYTQMHPITHTTCSIWLLHCELLGSKNHECKTNFYSIVRKC